MSDTPPADEALRWQKRFAAQANNRAWRLSEQPTRTPAEDEEMLRAAYAAAYLWQSIGNAGNHAHAALLLAHTHALLGRGSEAAKFEEAARSHFEGDAAQPWEVACARTVAANVAAALGNKAMHAEHHAAATRLIAALPDPEDREILEASLRVVPVPGAT